MNKVILSLLFLVTLAGCNIEKEENGSDSGPLFPLITTTPLSISWVGNGYDSLWYEFSASGRYETIGLSRLEYEHYLRLTDDISSSFDATNSVDIGFGTSLASKGTSRISMWCATLYENQQYFLKCNALGSETPINITGFISSLPKTLYIQHLVCTDYDCLTDYISFDIEADRTIDGSIEFIDSRGASVTSTYQSNTIVITGLNTIVDVYLDEGTLVKNGNEISGQSTTVDNLDTISIKLCNYSAHICHDH